MDNDPNTVIYNISVYYEKLDVMLCVEKKELDKRTGCTYSRLVS